MIGVKGGGLFSLSGPQALPLCYGGATMGRGGVICVEMHGRGDGSHSLLSPPTCPFRSSSPTRTRRTFPSVATSSLLCSCCPSLIGCHPPPNPTIPLPFKLTYPLSPYTSTHTHNRTTPLLPLISFSLIVTSPFSEGFLGGVRHDSHSESLQFHRQDR